MVRKKNNTSLIFIIFIISLLTISTGYKIYSNHSNKQYLVVKKEIEEAATKCILDEKCENTIYLESLIEKNYIEHPVNPLTKEYIDKQTLITCNNYVCIVNF